MDWAFVLVVILSVFLAIFLVLSIILAVMLIRVARQIRNITSAAERTAQTVESVASRVAKITTPVAVTKLVLSLIRNFKKSNKSRGGKDE